MKKEKFKYYLLAGVIIIWGYFFFLIYEDYFKKEKETTVDDFSANFIDPSTLKRDTFSILNNYRDPFLGSVIVSVSRSQNTGIISKKPALIPFTKKEFAWPSVRFNGIIKNQTSKKQVILLNVDGRDAMIDVGQKINDEIVLSRVWRDSIEITHKKDKRIIKK